MARKLSTQHNTTECKKSWLAVVLSSVPQGSELGPTSRAPSIIRCNCLVSLFADDILLYKEIERSCDYDAIQGDLDGVCTRFSRSHMSLNPSKCKYMIVSRNKIVNVPVNDLDRVSEFKYLYRCVAN